MNQEYRRPNVRHGSQQPCSQLRRPIPAIAGAREYDHRPHITLAPRQ